MVHPLLPLTLVGLLLAPSVSALPFEAWFRATLAQDHQLADLSRAEEQARIAWLRAAALRDSPRWELKTGDVVATKGGDSSPAWTMAGRPAAGVTLPAGPGFTLALPTSTTGAQTQVAPEVGGQVPLVRGQDPARLAAIEAEAALKRAQWVRIDRLAALERGLVERVRALLQADLAVGRAEQALLKAQREWDRARVVDGAAPGGAAYAEKERAVRLAGRDLRLAQGERHRKRAENALLAALSEGESIDLAPTVDLTLSLPTVDTAAPVIRAQHELAWAQRAREERARTGSLAAGWGLGYRKSWGDTASDGPTARTGLSAGLPGLQVDTSLTWAAGTPGLSMSLTWTPGPPGDGELEARAWDLTVEGAEAGLRRARDEAARTITDLEGRRGDLVLAGRDLADELAYAQDQRARVVALRAQGLADPAAQDEVELALRETETELNLRNLEAQLWDLDRRTLGSQEAPLP